MNAAASIKGDRAGADTLYVWRHGDAVYTDVSPAGILMRMHEKNAPVEINPDAIVFLLQNSLVPPPMSVFKNVYALGVGDYMEGNSFGCDYPYEQKKSTGQSVPSTRRLLELLCGSVQGKLAGEEAVLMMSSGKDSLSIALACAETGLQDKVACVTYADPASGYDDEAKYAAEVAKKLGLRHAVITVPSDPARVREALEHFFTHASYPSCDPTTIPYIAGLYHHGVRGTAILDGTRSDMYMGWVPTRSYDRLCRYYSLIGGGWTRFENLRSAIPYNYKINKLLGTVIEVNLFKHAHMHRATRQKFFPHDLDTARFWRQRYREYGNKTMTDRRNHWSGQYFDGAAVTIKAKTVAEALGCRSVMPWADAAIADYYFNLPREYRFDMKAGVNKILLRSMLKEYLGYDAAKIGKRIFYFNAARFLAANRDFIREEILACRLWNGNIGAELEKFMDRASRHARAAGTIIDLFMVSGWHNRCKYLKENQA